MKRIATVLVSGAMLVGVVAVAAAPASAASAAVKAAPNKKLVNGQQINVSGSHFDPNWPPTDGKHFVAVAECSAGVLTGDQAACDQTSPNNPQTAPGDAVLTNSDSHGKVGPVAFKVLTGTVGDGTCDSAHACYMTIAEVDTVSGPPHIDKFAFTKIAFK